MSEGKRNQFIKKENPTNDPINKFTLNLPKSKLKISSSQSSDLLAYQIIEKNISNESTKSGTNLNLIAFNEKLESNSSFYKSSIIETSEFRGNMKEVQNECDTIDYDFNDLSYCIKIDSNRNYKLINKNTPAVQNKKNTNNIELKGITASKSYHIYFVDSSSISNKEVYIKNAVNKFKIDILSKIKIYASPKNNNILDFSSFNIAVKTELNHEIRNRKKTSYEKTNLELLNVEMTENSNLIISSVTNEVQLYIEIKEEDISHNINYYVVENNLVVVKILSDNEFQSSSIKHKNQKTRKIIKVSIYSMKSKTSKVVKNKKIKNDYFIASKYERLFINNLSCSSSDSNFSEVSDKDISFLSHCYKNYVDGTEISCDVSLINKNNISRYDTKNSKYISYINYEISPTEYVIDPINQSFVSIGSKGCFIELHKENNANNKFNIDCILKYNIDNNKWIIINKNIKSGLWKKLNYDESSGKGERLTLKGSDIDNLKIKINDNIDILCLSSL